MIALLLKISIGAMIFAMGMNTTLQDLFYLWQRPALLIRSVVAMYLVLPLVVILMAFFLDLPPRTELALVVLAICAGAPLLPKKLMKFGGDPSYVLSLIVTTSLLAIITVPLSLHFLAGSTFFEIAPHVPSLMHIAGVILKSFLLPLGFGMAIRLVAPSLAQRYADNLLKVSGAVMALIAVVALILGTHLILKIGWPSLLAFALFTSAAIASGHLLGGPDPSNRTSLAIACASRHIGLALLIAANTRGEHALSLVVGYVIVSAVVSIAYFKWASKRLQSPSASARITISE